MIIEGIKTTPQVPGRFEVIGKKNKKVIIDYAHSADSLEKTLRIVNKINRDGAKILTVFGCGGNRDKLKRPTMGKIASELSNEVIITSDNPRDEDPIKIIDETGIKTTKMVIIPESKVHDIDASCTYCHSIFLGDYKVFQCEECGAYYHEPCLNKMNEEIKACRNCGAMIIYG